MLQKIKRYSINITLGFKPVSCYITIFDMVIYDILSIVFHEAFCTEKFSLHNSNLPKKNYIYLGKQTYGV